MKDMIRKNARKLLNKLYDQEGNKRTIQMHYHITQKLYHNLCIITRNNYFFKPLIKYKSV